MQGRVDVHQPEAEAVTAMAAAQMEDAVLLQEEEVALQGQEVAGHLQVATTEDVPAVVRHQKGGADHQAMDAGVKKVALLRTGEVLIDPADKK